MTLLTFLIIIVNHLKDPHLKTPSNIKFAFTRKGSIEIVFFSSSSLAFLLCIQPFLHASFTYSNTFWCHESHNQKGSALFARWLYAKNLCSFMQIVFLLLYWGKSGEKLEPAFDNIYILAKIWNFSLVLF